MGFLFMELELYVRYTTEIQYSKYNERYMHEALKSIKWKPLTHLRAADQVWRIWEGLLPGGSKRREVT